tara:strand:+ start:291 stop:437 length:147 start_codon:yes stop_codon:yes gene_type:complete
VIFNDPDAGPPRSLGFIKKRLAFLVEKQKKQKKREGIFNHKTQKLERA